LVQADGLALHGRLRPTSLSLAAGELTCLVGPNGSGKTSLLHALAGIGAPQGIVRIDGEDPSRAPPARRFRLLTYLPATRELRWPLEARDLVRLGGADPDEVEAVMSRLDLAAVAGRRLDHLSTGERSRVLIARALAPRPKLLLLDEPTANLDPLWQIRLLDGLKAEVVRCGQAALVAIHDLDAAARFGDRLLVMEEGKLVADGAPAEILIGHVIPDVFGIDRRDGEWQPVA
jgi:iron complex transport system ATP-binding protein